MVLLFLAHPGLLVGGDVPSPLRAVVHDVDIAIVLRQSLINTTDTLFNEKGGVKGWRRWGSCGWRNYMYTLKDSIHNVHNYTCISSYMWIHT